MAASPYSVLEQRIGISFRDTKNLEAALTHASTGGKLNYERLEFLGDRVLSLVMAQIIFELFPKESEGDLARRHASLVQGETLAVIARNIDLGSMLRLSDSERAGGGADNDNILSDGLEALIGALYLDSGLEPCSQMIRALWGDTVKTMKEPPQDHKTSLQEWAQGRGLPLPAYDVADRTGPDHAPIFTIRVTVQGFEGVSAQGASRRVAEKEAARLLLEKLKTS